MRTVAEGSLSREFCQNPKCPNKGIISVAIFKGTGACSDRCRKALGTSPK